MQLLKSLVDKGYIPIEILFGTKEDVEIFGKLNIASNHDPNFEVDNGIKKRGYAIELKNEFVEKANVDEKNGKYLDDANFLEKFDKIEYKMTFVKILLKYTKLFYINNVVNPPQKVKDVFKEVCENNDKMSIFLEENFDITLCVDDVIPKQIFMDMWLEAGNKEDFKKVSSNIKRFKLSYDKAKKNKGHRGCILGIKYKNT